MALSENATIENTLDKSVYTEDIKVGENAFTFAVGGNMAVITITITDSANDFKWTNTTKNTGWAVLDSKGNDVSDTAIIASGSFIKNYKWAQAGDFTIIVYAGAMSFEYQVTVAEA